MTMREVEIWLEGYRARQDSSVELLAWVQANLINVHIPKGKPRVTPKKLLPKGHGRRKTGADEIDDEELERIQDAVPIAGGKTRDGVKARMEAKRAKLRAKQELAEMDAFWSSAEGRRIREMMREEE